MDGIISELQASVGNNFEYNKVNGLCDDSNKYKYIGQRHWKMIKDLLTEFTNYLETPFMSDASKREYKFHIIYGVSKSGKSTSMDQICKELSKNKKNLVVSVTFNSYSEIETIGEWTKKEILNRFVIRLFYSIFNKLPNKEDFKEFEKKYLFKLNNVKKEDLTWNTIIELFEKYNILSKNQRLILVIDELILTGKGQKKINEHLYYFIKESLDFKPKIGTILSTLDVLSFFDTVSPTKNTAVESYPVPRLTNKEIDELVSDRNSMNLKFDEFYDKYDYSELYTRLVQPCLSVMIKICNDSKYLIDSNSRDVKDRESKLKNLWLAGADVCKVASKEIVFRGFNISYNKLEDKIGDKTIGELLFDGLLVQPNKEDIQGDGKITTESFLIKPNLMSLLRYFHSNSANNKIYSEMVNVLRKGTSIDKIGKSGIVKSGKQFEEVHMLFEALKRNVLFDCAIGINFERKNIEYQCNNYECIRMEMKDLFTKYASYYDKRIENNIIYLPNITDIVRLQCKFSESSLDKTTIDPNCIYIFEGKGSNNPGFDVLMSAFNENGKLVAIAIENRYSFSYDTSMNKYNSGNTGDKAPWLSEPTIDRKHSLLKGVLSGKQFGKDFYHVFVSFQQFRGIKDKNNLQAANNMIVLGGSDDINENVKIYSHYYGPSFVDLMSYFRNIDINFSKANFV